MENIWKYVYIYMWNVNVYGIYIYDVAICGKYMVYIYTWVIYGINLYIYILWNVYGIEYVWNIDRIYNRDVKQMNEI
jgi:hypothetical protein